MLDGKAKMCIYSENVRVKKNYLIEVDTFDQIRKYAQTMMEIHLANNFLKAHKTMNMTVQWDGITGLSSGPMSLNSVWNAVHSEIGAGLSGSYVFLLISLDECALFANVSFQFAQKLNCKSG